MPYHTSLAVLLEGLSEDQTKERMSEVSFFTLFGLLALIFSF
jgi:hypothetical protein